MKRCAIIGGGISGLSAAYFLSRKRPDITIDLYESTSRLGGVIRTEKIDDCIVEGGPDSFLTQKQSASALCRDVGLGDALIGSNDAFRKTFIYHQGKMNALPDGFFLMVPTRLSTLISTDLLSWPGKLSALLDLFSFPVQEDLPAADFIEARFGQEILDRIAEPMLTGIYGADIRRLSLKAGLPQIWELQKSGSLIKRLVSIRSENTQPSGSLFTTLRDGMESLPKGIVTRLPEVNWYLNSPVEYLGSENGKWKIGGQIYDAVIIATTNIPASNSGVIGELSLVYAALHRNSAVVIAFGFKDIKKEGFGWLVPLEERRSVLACTYSSNKFPGRSPEDRLLVRLFIGGKQADDWIGREDDELFKEALHELRRIAQIDQLPLFSRVFRWRNAMPEYQVDHEIFLWRIEDLRMRESNLYLTGNLFAGVGIPDCIRHADKVASLCASVI